jgi:hypothetical protein
VQKHIPAVLRQAICRRQGCHRLFFICRFCDRGQVYCSPECRNTARREQHRAANRRYSQSPEAILDHRQRQNDYRRRKAGLPPRLKEIVTDHTSAPLSRSSTMPSSDSSLSAPFYLKAALCRRHADRRSAHPGSLTLKMRSPWAPSVLPITRMKSCPRDSGIDECRGGSRTAPAL